MFEINIKLRDFPEPETKSMALIQKIQELLCHLVSDPPAQRQSGANVAGRHPGDLQQKEQPVPVTDNLEWETKAPCRVGWIIN